MLTRVCRSGYEITRQQIEQMFVLMRKHGGIGLAAPQVGIDARLFITDWGQVFHDPKIIGSSVSVTVDSEGCLSIPGKVFRVARYDWIELKTGEVFRGFKARVIQHEMDHLNGVLISQRHHA